MGRRLERFILFLKGYRKLFVAITTLLVVVFMFGITLGLLLKAFLNGGQFVDIVKALASVISTVIVAYMATNMGKHLLDAGKECVQDYIKGKKK